MNLTAFFAFINELLEDRRKPGQLWNRRFSTTLTHPSSGLCKTRSGDGSDDWELQLSRRVPRLYSPLRSDIIGSFGGKTTATTTSTTSVGSSSKVNSPVSIKPTERKENTIKEIDEIMENLYLKETSGYSDMDPKETLTTSVATLKRISSPAMAMSLAILKTHGDQD
jgi:hypothetical protein